MKFKKDINITEAVLFIIFVICVPASLLWLITDNRVLFLIGLAPIAIVAIFVCCKEVINLFIKIFMEKDKKED